jgi:hypothetical protein
VNAIGERPADERHGLLGELAAVVIPSPGLNIVRIWDASPGI